MGIGDFYTSSRDETICPGPVRCPAWEVAWATRRGRRSEATLKGRAWMKDQSTTKRGELSLMSEPGSCRRANLGFEDANKTSHRPVNFRLGNESCALLPGTQVLRHAWTLAPNFSSHLLPRRAAQPPAALSRSVVRPRRRVAS